MLIEFEVKRELPIGLVILLPLERLEQILDVVRGECRFAQYAHDLEYWPPDFEVVLDDGNEAVRDDCYMYLDSHSVLGLSPKTLDLKMLLDPFEKQFHLPSIFIEKGDFFRLEVEVVRIVDKAAMQLKLFCNPSLLRKEYHVEGKLLKDAVVSELAGLREHLSVDRLRTKAEEYRLLSMDNSKICKFSETAAAHELTEHQNQHVIPMRHRPPLGSVVVLGDYAPELPLWEELDYLYKNELSNMHICSDLKLDTKVSISKPGQRLEELKPCA